MKSKMKSATEFVKQIQKKEETSIEAIRDSYMRSLKNKNRALACWVELLKEFLDEFPHLITDAKFIKDMQETYYDSDCGDYSWREMLDEWRDKQSKSG